MNETRKKLERLKAVLKGYGRTAVAFSGGVDSTFLLKVAHDALGDGCMAVTVRSCMFPVRESGEAAGFCAREGVRHLTIDASDLLSGDVAANPPDRCYICKRRMFGMMLNAAAAEGATVLCEGSNTDDLLDYRPGLRAVAELGIRSPLRECGLSKSEIRELSAELGLPTAGKPSFACLASRIPYGDAITPEKLGMIEKAEDFLRDAGFGQVRVRLHGGVARIEVDPGRIADVLEMRGRIVSALREYGFAYVSLDLQGYRTGSLNGPGMSGRS